ncbi:DNA internalization-related competence protein ComEC/Rec2 [Pasteurellaceae bacterium 15-036681]|nr:DNA internalization-related competence protein ComEC/Rec2 [Pasteurellaceae bacterium 15-036681]
MNLDKFCLIIFTLLIPILFLPIDLLWLGMGIGLLLLCFSVFRVNGWGLLFSIILFSSYGQILFIVKQADNVTASKSAELIQINQILKQQDYQTAIAKRANGEHIFVNWQSETELLLGRTYQANLNLRPISSRQNIGNFDRQKWYFAQDIRALATIKQAQLLDESKAGLRTNWLYRVKQQIEELDTEGLLLALAFGERAWLKAEQWNTFQQTATAHLIAISGLHIGLAMFFGFGFAKLVQWVLLKIGIKSPLVLSYLFPRLIGFMIAFGYSFLAGFAIPTVRALIAISLVLVCQYARRHYTPWQLWVRCVVLLLVLDPLALLSDSFWLSILAVASLIVWYQFFPIRLFWCYDFFSKSKVRLIFYSLGHLQLGIWLVFSPIQLFFFGGISSFGFIANLLIVPLYSFLLVPLILFSLFTDNLFFTWQLADLIGQFSLILIGPFSDFWFDLSSKQQWYLLSVNLLILLTIYGYIQHKAKVYWGLVISIPLLFNQLYKVPQWLFPQPIIQWLNFDVGQGLAMAFIYHNASGQKRAVFYDTGASWQGKNGTKGGSMAQLEIIPYLKHHGIEIEAIFVSHDDNDHSGGVTDLLTAYPAAKLVLSGQNHYSKSGFEQCIQGEKWQFGELKMQALYPIQLAYRAKNEDSCVLVAEIGAYKILLTGDSGVAEERQYANQIGKLDFLQVGHHGSLTSTSHTLLASTQPDVAIISSGRWNPWKMPRQEIIERLIQYRAIPINTATSGMITVNFYQNGYKIITARDLWQPWYRRVLGKIT